MPPAQELGLQLVAVIVTMLATIMLIQVATTATIKRLVEVAEIIQVAMLVLPS